MPMTAPPARVLDHRTAILAALAVLAPAASVSAQDRPLGEVDGSDGQRRTVAVWVEPGLTRSPVA